MILSWWTRFLWLLFFPSLSTRLYNYPTHRINLPTFIPSDWEWKKVPSTVCVLFYLVLHFEVATKWCGSLQKFRLTDDKNYLIPLIKSDKVTNQCTGSNRMFTITENTIPRVHFLSRTIAPNQAEVNWGVNQLLRTFWPIPNSHQHWFFSSPFISIWISSVIMVVDTFWCSRGRKLFQEPSPCTPRCWCEPSKQA